MNLIFKRFLQKRRYNKRISINVDDIPIAFGADFDLKDKRDQFKEIKGGTPSDKYYLDKYSHKARNQWQTGSCVGFAVTSAEHNVKKRAFYNVDDRDILLSANYVYYNARLLRGWQDRDSGSYIRDGLKVLQKNGACLDYNWPISKSIYKKPPNFVYKSKIKSYKRIGPNSNLSKEDLIYNLMYCISVEELPVIISAKLYENILKETKTLRSGFIRTPSKNELKNTKLNTYGHALYFDGYDYNKRIFTGMNSWSNRWGDNGRFYLKFDYATNRNLVRDFWTFGYEIW